MVAVALFRTREMKPKSHIPTILTTHVIQRMADLAEAVGFDGFHQCGENVLAVAGGFLQVG